MTVIVIADPFLDKVFPVLQGYGKSQIDYSRYGLIGHNGIDFGCPEGTLLYASYLGTVTRAGYDPEGYGNYIRITTNFGRLIYAHLSVPSVTVNSKVTTGMFIGRSGNTGNSTVPHLHFEMRLDGQEGNGFNGAVDPLPYMNEVTTPIPTTPIVPTISLPNSGTFTVSIPYLNLRNTNSTAGFLVGRLMYGTVLPYKRTALDEGCNTWLQIADGLWCAGLFNGEQYVTV